MRVLVGTIIFLLVLTAVGFYSQAQLNAQARLLVRYADNMENFIEANKWKAASQELSKFEKHWADIQDHWDLIIEHHEMDSVDEAIAKLKKYLQTKNLDLALGELSIVKHFLQHIPKKEIFNLQNIL